MAQQFNGSAAVIDSLVGHRLGLWNPSIYSFASGSASPFTPLDQAGASNDDLYFSGTARALYDQGAGLGYPDLARLGTEFAGQ